MRDWLHSQAAKHPCRGFRHAWAALRYASRREANNKKIHGRWHEEGLQVKTAPARKRAEVPPMTPHSRLTSKMRCGRSVSSSNPPSMVPVSERRGGQS